MGLYVRILGRTTASNETEFDMKLYSLYRVSFHVEEGLYAAMITQFEITEENNTQSLCSWYLNHMT